MANVSTIPTTTTTPVKLTTIDPLLHNMSCDVPHDDVDKIYTYSLTSDFVAFSTFVAVVNFLLILPTALSNLFIVLGLMRRSESLTNVNRLLASLCLADFFIGIMVEPIFGAHIIQVTKAGHHCGLSNFFIYIVPVTIVITMVTHMAISLELYFSIHYPKTYKKIFTKTSVTIFAIFVWAISVLCFVVPLITGKVVLGTRITVCLILVSLAVCSYCYLSIYQDFKQQHGRPKVEFKGPTKVTPRIEVIERTPEEEEAFQANLKSASFFAKLFGCMVVIYILTLIKNVLNAYDVFPGNGYYTMHFLFDTILFLHALLNSILIFYLSPDIYSSAMMVFG